MDQDKKDSIVRNIAKFSERKGYLITQLEGFKAHPLVDYKIDIFEKLNSIGEFLNVFPNVMSEVNSNGAQLKKGNP